VVTDWRLRRWRLWFLALSNAPRDSSFFQYFKVYFFSEILRYWNTGRETGSVTKLKDQRTSAENETVKKVIIATYAGMRCFCC